MMRIDPMDAGSPDAHVSELRSPRAPMGNRR